MVQVLFLQLPWFTACKHLSRHSLQIGFQQQADGRIGSLSGSTDEGAEQDIGQGIEPHIHADDVGRHDARIGCVDGDSLVFQLSGQPARE